MQGTSKEMVRTHSSERNDATGVREPGEPYTYVDDADEETPPTSKDKVTGAAGDGRTRRIAVLIVVGHEHRRSDGDDERNNGEDSKGNGVAPANVGGVVSHVDCCSTRRCVESS